MWLLLVCQWRGQTQWWLVGMRWGTQCGGWASAPENNSLNGSTTKGSQCHDGEVTSALEFKSAFWTSPLHKTPGFQLSNLRSCWPRWHSVSAERSRCHSQRDPESQKTTISQMFVGKRWTASICKMCTKAVSMSCRAAHMLCEAGSDKQFDVRSRHGRRQSEFRMLLVKFVGGSSSVFCRCGCSEEAATVREFPRRSCFGGSTSSTKGLGVIWCRKPGHRWMNVNTDLMPILKRRGRRRHAARSSWEKCHVPDSVSRGRAWLRERMPHTQRCSPRGPRRHRGWSPEKPSNSCLTGPSSWIGRCSWRAWKVHPGALPQDLGGARTNISERCWTIPTHSISFWRRSQVWHRLPSLQRSQQHWWELDWLHCQSQTGVCGVLPLDVLCGGWLPGLSQNSLPQSSKPSAHRFNTRCQHEQAQIVLDTCFVQPRILTPMPQSWALTELARLITLPERPCWDVWRQCQLLVESSRSYASAVRARPHTVGGMTTATDARSPKQKAASKATRWCHCCFPSESREHWRKSPPHSGPGSSYVHFSMMCTRCAIRNVSRWSTTRWQSVCGALPEFVSTRAKPECGTKVASHLPTSTRWVPKRGSQKALRSWAPQ